MQEIKKIVDLKTYNPKEQNDAQLRDDYRIAAAWYSSIKAGQKLKWSQSQVENLTINILKEILSRGIEKFTPLGMKPASKELFMKSIKKITLPGVILVEPHAQNSIKRKKTLIIKTKPFKEITTKPVHLISKNLSYGVAKLEEPKEISFKKFHDLRRQHLITEEERLKWAKTEPSWNKEPLYSFDFKVLVEFEKPVNITRKVGTQVYQREVIQKKVELKDPKELSDEDLLEMYHFLHEAWRKKEDGKKVPEFPERTFEAIINYYVLVVQEMQRRKMEYTPIDELDEQAKPFLKSFAPVHHSGVIEGREIILKDVLGQIKSFLPYPTVAWIVGGLANWGKTKGDIDVLWKITDSFPDWFKNVLMFRFGRQFSNPDFASRVQHHFDAYRGPFTNAVEIYRMNIERVNPQGQIKEAGFEVEPKIVKMLWDEEKEGYIPDDIIYRIEKQLRAGTPEIKEQADISAKKDEVKVSRFFLPLKPTRGYKPEQRQTIENFLALFKPENFPVWSSKKYDGANHEVHKKGDTVKIYSEDGEDNTDRFPKSVEEFKKLSDKDFVLLDEVELWREGKHLPREAVVGYVHAKDEPDDSELIHNIYDIVYLEKDIHKVPFEERIKNLQKLNIKQSTFGIPDMKYRINGAPYLVSKDLKELEGHTERLRKLPGSEGNVAKFFDFIYFLDGRRSGMIKFHNSAILNGIVTEVKETKVKDIFNYTYGIDPQNYAIEDVVVVDEKTFLKVGKTFSTSIKAKKGDVIEVEYETLNLEKHETDDEEFYKVTCWSPRVMKVLE